MRNKRNRYKRDSNLKKVKVLTVIPYQVCPRCEGSGRMTLLKISTPANVNYRSAPCTVCNGQKIIPMCVVQTNYEHSVN